MDDVKMIVRIPTLRASLFHKVESLKCSSAKDIEEYREIERVIDPEKKGKTNEKTEESVKQIKFEIKKKKGGWTVKPAIPQEIVNHIIGHFQDFDPGVIKMEKFKLAGGKIIDLSCEMQAWDYFTGSIKVKSTKKSKKETSKQSKQEDKKEVIRTLLTYILNNENFYYWMKREFYGNWKPLIDKGCLASER